MVPHHRRLLDAAIDALHITGTQLSNITGVSKRTAQRWFTSSYPPLSSYMEDIARAVHPVDAKLAGEIAESAGTSLAALGLEAPAAPAAPQDDLLVDSVVCAAAEAISIAPHAVRPALLAAFRRARRLGLSLETVEGALEKSAPK